MWERVVVHKCEIFVFIVEDVFYFGIDQHAGEWARCACELFTHLIEVVVIDVRVSECMHEVAGLKSADLRYHHRE